MPVVVPGRRGNDPHRGGWQKEKPTPPAFSKRPKRLKKKQIKTSGNRKVPGTYLGANGAMQIASPNQLEYASYANPSSPVPCRIVPRSIILELLSPSRLASKRKQTISSSTFIQHAPLSGALSCEGVCRVNPSTESYPESAMCMSPTLARRDVIGQPHRLSGIAFCT